MEYISATGIYYKNEIESIKKKTGEQLRPVFEAVTNSWESLLQKFGDDGLDKGKIDIVLYVQKQLALGESNTVYNFLRIDVSDNGQGLTADNYDRVIDLRDDRKGYRNKGTGRVQFLHFFDETRIDSVFCADGKTRFRTILTMSKNNDFIKNNAFVRIDRKEEEVGENEPILTTITFEKPLDKKDSEYYANITISELKKLLVRHFLTKFCDAKERMPQMTVTRIIVDGKSDTSDRLSIEGKDVPSPATDEEIDVNYSKMGDNNAVEPSAKTERFQMRSFVLPSSELDKNEIHLVSKGETAQSFPFYDLRPDETIKGRRYMVLLSGDYIDNNDSDTRGNLRIITTKEFKKIHSDAQGDLFENEVVLLDDIKDRINTRIRELHGEIKSMVQARSESVDKLRRMFLLNAETVNVIRSKIRNTDTDESILRKIYEADSEIKARQDAELKRQIDEINTLSPTDVNYQEELNRRAEALVLNVPLQNRTALSQYIARRKIVLSLFQKILERNIKCLKDGDRIDEKLLHNLIFQQSSDKPEESDLWLIDEDFIYFRGVSEKALNDIEYGGRRIFDKEFSEEDKRYLNSLGEKRLNKRPDILLFPEEGKCIIIEFKAPDVNVAEHLTQINFYASLLYNYTVDEFHPTRFYGYLIGEGIEDRDVRGRVSNFQVASRFGFWYCPSADVTGFDGKANANIYTEIIKYSSLLKRAMQRNEVFIKKLGLMESDVTK
jgi:hypothetical protein